jgi:hypothetical protein
MEPRNRPRRSPRNFDFTSGLEGGSSVATKPCYILAGGGCRESRLPNSFVEVSGSGKHFSPLILKRDADLVLVRVERIARELHRERNTDGRIGGSIRRY